MKIPEKFASSLGGRAGVESELGVLKRYPDLQEGLAGESASAR